MPIIPATFSVNYLNSLSHTILTLQLPDRMCNEKSYTTFDISQFINLKSLTIGDFSFNHAKVFVLKNLPALKTISIGKNCFMNVENANMACFQISKCPHLRSFVVQEWSFVKCGGVIDISKLKRLKTIQIGSTSADSHNFTNASLYIHGMEFVLSS